MNDLAGKHVLVTGAAKRVGRALSEASLKEGANVSLHFHRSQESIADFSNEKRTRAIQGDLTQSGDIRRIALEAEKAFGGVDVLIHSASDFFSTDVSTCTEKEWEHLMTLNLKAPFFLTQALLPKMKPGSLIVHLCDTKAERGGRNYAPYLVSKAGLMELTRALAAELAPRIRVNSISPGIVLPPDSYDLTKIRRIADQTLLKRIGSPQDIVQAFLYFVRSPYVTGADLKVDGGWV